MGHGPVPVLPGKAVQIGCDGSGIARWASVSARISSGLKMMMACLNGDANCVLANTSALHDYVESGQLVPLLRFNKTAFDDPAWGLDSIPSVAEAGYPDIAVEPCSILCCRKDADPVDVEAMRGIITDYLSRD